MKGEKSWFRGQVFKFHFWPCDLPLTHFSHRYSNRHRTPFATPKMKFEDLPPDWPPRALRPIAIGVLVGIHAASILLAARRARFSRS